MTEAPRGVRGGGRGRQRLRRRARAAENLNHPPPPLQWENVDVTAPITHDNFVATLGHYPIVIVNFYAPW